MRNSGIPPWSEKAARGCAIMLGFSIPISTWVDNALLVLILVFWLLSFNFRAKVMQISRNPVALAACALFGLLAVGVAYGAGDVGAGLQSLRKYLDLLFVPVLLTLFRDEQSRKLGLKAFGAAIILTLIISHLVAQGLLGNDNSMLPSRQESTGATGAFKYSITHSLLICLGAFLFVVLAREETRRVWRIAYIFVALVAAHNVLFMVMSRTGYLVFAVLLLYFFVGTFGRRGVAIAALLGIGLFVSAYHGSETFHARTHAAASQLKEWRLGQPSNEKNPVGVRLDWYSTSLQLIREHPLLGSGTGSFPAAYARAIEGRNMVATGNPHNEYLMIAVQIGGVGLACLLYLFWRQWQFAGQLVQSLYRDLGRGLMLTFFIGCLFNSMLLDHAEGLLFAWMSALIFSAPTKPASSSTS